MDTDISSTRITPGQSPPFTLLKYPLDFVIMSRYTGRQTTDDRVVTDAARRASTVTRDTSRSKDSDYDPAPI